MTINAPLKQKNNQDFQLVIRQYIPEDLDFIKSSFGCAIWKSGYNFLSPKSSFIDRHNAIIDVLIEQGAKVIVACDKNDLLLPVGYMIYQQYGNLPVIHFCYVRQLYRRNGLATQLINAIGLNENSTFYCSFCTYICKIAHEQGFKVVYLPQLIDKVWPEL